MKQTQMKTLSRLFKYMSRQTLLIVGACLCTLVSALTAVQGTNMLRPIINEHIVPLIGHVSPSYPELLGMIAIMGGFYLLSAVTLLFSTQIMTVLCNNTICRIRKDLFQHMQKLPMQYFDTHASGEIMNRYNNDVNALDNALRQSLPQMLNGVATSVSIFISMLILCPPLMLIVALCAAVMVAVNAGMLKRNNKYFREQQATMGALNGYALEVIRNHNLVKLFVKEEETVGRFEEYNQAYAETAEKTNLYSGSMFPVSSGISNVGFAVISLAGMLLISKGLSDVGVVCAFLQHYKRFYTPIVQMSRQVNNILSAISGAERIFQMMDEPPEADEGTQAPVSRNLQTGISFNHVVFGYRPDQQVIKDVSLDVKCGQKVAIVGTSGAGKTTIMYLLNRFYDLSGGEILIDGVSVRDLPKETLRKMMSIVLQDTHLFTGTIMENIRFGRQDASDEEVMAAAKLVNADFFIRHLPDQYHTFITEDGGMLSEGQRQLLSMARAAVSNAPILIMDEATSMVDTRTEQLIGQGLQLLMRHKTIFLVAHRLETVRNADIIVVMKEGKIAEIGDHQELMTKRGMYYELNMGWKELL